MFACCALGACTAPVLFSSGSPGPGVWRFLAALTHVASADAMGTLLPPHSALLCVCVEHSWSSRCSCRRTRQAERAPGSCHLTATKSGKQGLLGMPSSGNPLSFSLQPRDAEDRSRKPVLAKPRTPFPVDLRTQLLETKPSSQRCLSSEGSPAADID